MAGTQQFVIYARIQTKFQTNILAQLISTMREVINYLDLNFTKEFMILMHQVSIQEKQ